MPTADGMERERIGSRVIIFKTQASPFWYMQFNYQGRQYRPSLRTKSRKEARRIALAKDAELVLGKATLPATRGPDLEKNVAAFLDHLKGKDRSPETIRAYRQYLHQFRDWAAVHSIRRLDQINLQTLETYQQALVNGGIQYHRHDDEDGEETSAPNMRRTVRSKMKTLRSLQRWALKRGILAKDPAAGYELPPQSKDQAYCFTQPELVAIFNAAEAPYRNIFMFLAMTGLRISEMLFLTKADVDLKDGLVHVRAKVISETGEHWGPKHGKERIVPLTPEARQIVESQMATSPGPWVFSPSTGHGARSGRFKSPQVRDALQQAKKVAGVKQGKIHTFRHAFCSHLAQQPNVTAFEAMKIMGHFSLDIILVYFHTTSERLCSVMSKVSFAAMLNGVTESAEGKEVNLAKSQQTQV